MLSSRFLVVSALCLMLVAAARTGRAQTALDPEVTRQLRNLEDSMVHTADSMYLAPTLEDRQQHVYQLVRQLKAALSLPNSYAYGFDSLASRINVISAPDNAFRIFNWSIAPTEMTRRYYGAVQLPGPQLRLYGLLDQSAELGKQAEDSILTGGKWYGALYYRIMPVQVDGQTVYTLFGMNAGNPTSNKKVLDVLTLTEQGPVFGAPIFGIRSAATRGRVSRFIMEYKKSVQASLNWDKERNAIYFDRLVSEVNDPNRKYTFVPSGQYDGFRWQDGKWEFVSDLISIMELKDGDKPIGGLD
jgi:hypothetical protein